MPRRIPSAALLAAATIALGACAAAGTLLHQLFQERPPHSLDHFDVASDARIDSSGGLRGSFVGEGTSRAVHLVSSDTAFIAALVRRYRPDAVRNGDLWGSLSRAGTVTINPVSMSENGGRYRPMVGSPEGHTDVELAAVITRGGSCGWRGAQAELIVEAPPASSQVPTLRGPVVGSFRLASEVSDRQIRRALPAPSSNLVTTLIDRTSHAMDSMIGRRLQSRELPLRLVEDEPPPVNSLLDVDAVDLLPIMTLRGDTRYVVSLRQQEVTALGDTVVAAAVMVWDSAGTWEQTVFEPTLLDLRRGRVTTRQGSWTPVYWRRLQAVSGFEYQVDYVWMEQVSTTDGSVLWGIIDPNGNVVVAAAEMQGPCTK